MEWALINGERVKAEKSGQIGICPGCDGEVRAKCGEIVSWHWAHINADCDPWSEPETEWHKQWKNHFPPEWQEVVLDLHRADVKTPKGVIEFQNSPINPAEIKERESFYGKMIWIVNALNFKLDRYDYWNHKRFLSLNSQPIAANLFDSLVGKENPKQQEDWKHFQKRLRKYLDEEHAKAPCYRWLWPRKTWLHANKTIILDRGEGQLLRIKKIYGQRSVYLACSPLTTESLLRNLGVQTIATS